MLTRPAHRRYSASPVEPVPDRGGLRHARHDPGRAAAWPPVLWLYQLHGRMQEQRRRRSRPWPARSSRSAGGQRLAIDTLLEKAGGDDPAEFVARYDKAAKARDDAMRQLDHPAQSINETLGGRAKELEAQAAKLDGRSRGRATRLVAKYEKDAKDAPEPPRAGRQPRGSRSTSQQRELDELARSLDTAEGKKAVEISRRAHPHSATRPTAADGLAALLAWPWPSVTSLQALAESRHPTPRISIGHRTRSASGIA